MDQVNPSALRVAIFREYIVVYILCYLMEKRLLPCICVLLVDQGSHA